MTNFFNSIFGRLLRRLGRGVWRHPRWFVYPQIILFALSVFYTLVDLKLDMKRSHLVGGKSKAQEVFSKFQKEFAAQDDLVVVVQSGNPEINREFVERLGAKLQSETNLFKNVFYKADLTTLGSKGLLLASQEDLAHMRQALQENLPFIRQFDQATNLNSLFQQVNRQFLSSSKAANAKTTPLIKEIPALERILVQARESISGPGTPPPPEFGALLGGTQKTEQASYVTFRQGQLYLLTAEARTGSLNPKAIERLSTLIQQTQTEVPGESAGLTGQAVLSYYELRQAERDSKLASVVSLVLCSLLFISAYGQIRRPLMAAVCLVVGLAFTMGFTTLVIGHLNILSVTFAPMLIGLAIDFGIHFISRYEEEQRLGRTETGALDKAMVFTGQGIFVGACTTAAAFLAMALTHFKGIQEMGIISGGGLIICLIPMLTLLPVLLRQRGETVRRPQTQIQTQKRVQIEKTLMKYPWLVVAILLAMTAAAVPSIHRVYFDYDLLHMQSPRLPAVYYEDELIQSGSHASLFASVMADNIDQARQYKARLLSLPSVASVESAADFITPDQTNKLQLVRAIKDEVQQLHFAPVDPRPVDPIELKNTLFILDGYVGLAQDRAKQSDPALAGELTSLRQAIVELNNALLGDEPRIPERLARFQQLFFGDLRRTFDAIKNQDTSGPLRLDDLPPILRQRFIGVTGKLLLQVYPKKDMWVHANQKEFIKQLRSVMPEDKVAGTPFELYQYTTVLKNSYQQAAGYALAAIVVMLFLYFRSLSSVLLALLPVAIGATWLLGFMGFSGIPFNPANIMTLPLVIGIGVNNGIQILNRLMEEGKPGILSKSTGKAVIVSGLTSTIGFGSLMLAKHQGIFTLGVIMSVGIASCLVVSVTLLPALLHILMRHGWTIERRRQPQ